MTQKQGPPNTSDASQETEDQSYPALGMDLMIFAHHLDGTDLSAQQKQEYLQMFWQVACCFADLGHGLGPLSLACGKEAQDTENMTLLISDLLCSQNTDPSKTEEPTP